LLASLIVTNGMSSVVEIIQWVSDITVPFASHDRAALISSVLRYRIQFKFATLIHTC